MTTQDFPKISVLVASATDTLNEVDTLLDEHSAGENIEPIDILSLLVCARDDVQHALDILNGVTESEGGEA